MSSRISGSLVTSGSFHTFLRKGEDWGFPGCLLHPRQPFHWQASPAMYRCFSSMLSLSQVNPWRSVCSQSADLRLSLTGCVPFMWSGFFSCSLSLLKFLYWCLPFALNSSFLFYSDAYLMCSNPLSLEAILQKTRRFPLKQSLLFLATAPVSIFILLLPEEVFSRAPWWLSGPNDSTANSHIVP